MLPKSKLYLGLEQTHLCSFGKLKLELWQYFGSTSKSHSAMWLGKWLVMAATA